MTRLAARPHRLAIPLLVAMLSTAAFASLVGAARAQSSNPFEVVMHVNQSIITGYDVGQRARLLSFAAGRELANVERTALDELIIDTLKLQEANRRGVELTKEGLGEALDRVARNNGIETDAFVAALKSAGVEQDTFEFKLKADLLWRKTLQRRFGERMRPSDGEVEAELEQSSTRSETVYHVKQIVAEVSPRASKAEVRKAFEKAVSLRQQLSSCDKLDALAKKLGPPSGDVGKLPASQMPAPIRDAVLKLETGQTTDPLRTQNGVHVIMLCGIGEAKSANREQIERQLLAQKATRFSESYVEELKRAAVITR